MNQIVALKYPVSGPAIPVAAIASSYRLDHALSIEIRPLVACQDIRQEWSDLASRAVEPNLFFEPDFALAAAQHLVAFRAVQIILVWQSTASRPCRRLIGLVPCFPRNRLLVPDELIGFSDPRIFNGAPLLDRQDAETAVEAVLTQQQRRNLPGHGLILRRIDLDSPVGAAFQRAAERLGLSAIQRRSTQLIQPGATPLEETETLRRKLAQQGKLALVEAGSRIEARDAIEIVLAMEASGSRARAGAAALQDTREVGFLRAMTRGLARNRQCRVGLLMLDEQPIAGAIVIGRAQRGWLYMTAQNDAHTPFAPERVLLAMMRQAAPARTILLPGGASAIGFEAATFGELRLIPRPARKPRTLATRARDALRRSVFKRPRAGAAG